MGHFLDLPKQNKEHEMGRFFFLVAFPAPRSVEKERRRKACKRGVYISLPFYQHPLRAALTTEQNIEADSAVHHRHYYHHQNS